LERLEPEDQTTPILGGNLDQRTHGQGIRGADLLAKTAREAPSHINFKKGRRLPRPGGLSRGSRPGRQGLGGGWNHADTGRWTNLRAKSASDTPGNPLVRHQDGHSPDRGGPFEGRRRPGGRRPGRSPARAPEEVASHDPESPQEAWEPKTFRHTEPFSSPNFDYATGHPDHGRTVQCLTRMPDGSWRPPRDEREHPGRGARLRVPGPPRSSRHPEGRRARSRRSPTIRDSR
jgi:hypothetical protein